MLRKLLKWIFNPEENKIELNLKKYETNREIHSNKKNKRRA